jgi:hypothetical protein
VPYTPPTPQTLADLMVRRSQRRDCSPPAPRCHPTPSPSPVSAVGDPKVVGISSEPPPVPPRHRQSPWRPFRRQHPRGVPRPTKVCPTPFFSLSYLDKIRLPRPNLCGSDPEYDSLPTKKNRVANFQSIEGLGAFSQMFIALNQHSVLTIFFKKKHWVG